MSVHQGFELIFSVMAVILLVTSGVCAWIMRSGNGLFGLSEVKACKLCASSLVDGVLLLVCALGLAYLG